VIGGETKMNLEQREQDIRNALAKVGIESASQVVKLIKRDNAAEVYINGQYFDTYDFNKKEFLEYSSEFVSDNLLIEESNEMMMYALINNEHCVNDPYYAGVKLQLPASDDNAENAFEQAGITSLENCRVEHLCWKNYVFDSDEITEATIAELNFFSRRVYKMDQEMSLAFEACLLINQKYQGIKELINLTYSLENCRILHGIGSDTELGQYYVDNGLVEDLNEIPETIIAFIDYEKIGKTMRESENGIFLEGCYIRNESNELVQVYDGINLPKSYDFDNTITVYISFEDNTNEKSLHLPADEEHISDFMNGLQNIIVSFNSMFKGTVKPNNKNEE
jgi:hypothetical protein